MTAPDSWYDLFLRIVEGAFRGTLTGRRAYQFSPRLLRPYDLLKTVGRPKDDYDHFISDLDPRFVSVAKSEMYRSSKGWIDKSVSAHQIRSFSLDSNQYLVPRFVKSSAVGIDTSSDGNTKLIGIFVIPDDQAAATFFDMHLGLPKTHNHAEWKWNKLNDEHRNEVLRQFDVTLRVCCEAGLMISTDVLSSGKGHAKDKLTNLVEGCFSGYEATGGQRRKELRSLFFSRINEVPVHCDSDFAPVSSEDVVRTLVRQLARTDSGFGQFTPMNVPLRSHESIPIQIADVLVGALKELRVRGLPIRPFDDLWFDLRKIRSWKGSYAKAAYFVA